MNLIGEFKRWLIEEGKAAKTIESYVGDVEGFQKFLAAFVRYKQYLLDENFAIATINKKINSLKVYNDFLRMKGEVGESFIHIKRDQVNVRQHLINRGFPEKNSDGCSLFLLKG